jgi:hypothetical protein
MHQLAELELKFSRPWHWILKDLGRYSAGVELGKYQKELRSVDQLRFQINLNAIVAGAPDFGLEDRTSASEQPVLTEIVNHSPKYMDLLRTAQRYHAAGFVPTAP